MLVYLLALIVIALFYYLETREEWHKENRR